MNNEVKELTIQKFKLERYIEENLSELCTDIFKGELKEVNKKLERLESKGYCYDGYYILSELETIYNSSEITIYAIKDKKGVYNIVARHMQDGLLVCKGRTFLSDIRQDARVIANEMREELKLFGCQVSNEIVFQ